MARHSAEIEQAENGHIVRVTCDNEKDGYQSKRFVAMSLPEAQRIAGAALSGKIKIGKKKARGNRGIGAEVAQAPRKRPRRKRSH